MKWNEQQQKAIYAKDKNVLISASAGAGKTSVLIARLMYLIQEEGVGVDEILAMTFSEAAAAEMKKRLSIALHKSLKTSEDPQFIHKQLANLSSAHISTIHGFCLSVIQEYYYIIGLDKKRVNNPVDEVQATKLKNEALSYVLNQAYQMSDFANFSLNYTKRAETNGSLEADIIGLAELASSKSNPYEFLVDCKNTYKSIDSIVDIDEKIYAYFKDYFLIGTELLADLSQKAYMDCEATLFEEKRNDYKEAIKFLINQDYDQYRLLFMQGIKHKMPAPAKSVFIKEIETKEKELLSNLYEEKTYVKYHNEQIQDVHLFVDLTKLYMEKYESLKKENHVIDFNDMEQYAIQILRANDHYVANIYKDKFHSIMVDEFQDSNDVQDELVCLLAKENNVFRVGDIKQSIYGFRHALPSIMRNLIHDTGVNDELIFLRHNYRSTKTIVDFNNELFDRLMNVQGLTSSYTEDDYVATGTIDQEQVKIPVTMHLLDKKAICAEAGEIYSTSQLKSSYIVHQVQAMQKLGYSYRDMVILVRGNASMIEIKKEFDKANIPCFYNRTQGFYDSKSVQTITSYLKALVNPNDDLAFVSILTSEIYQKDVEFLAQAKLNKNQESFASYLKNDESLSSYYELYTNLSNYSLHEILESIYNMNDFYMNYTNAQERANLDMLYEMVCEYEANEAISIQGFLSYLNDQRDIEVGEAMPIGANDDVVRIMTIHKSKGLQFKVVFFYSSSKFMNANISVMSFDEDLKIAMDYTEKKYLVRYPSIAGVAMRQKKWQEYLEEEQRLLYVATTRAQEVLHIVDTGEQKELEPYSIHEFYKGKGYTDWIRKAFLLPNELFTYCYVNEMWSNKVEADIEETYTFISYKETFNEIKFVSPSDSEAEVYKPSAFSLAQDAGLTRGTTLHAMVEHLPKTRWNELVINEVSNMLKVNLDSHDKEVLYKLRENTLFDKALTFDDVYYEYPFMVKGDNDIMHGFMDFLAVNEDETIMVDFKSDRGVSEEVLEKRYAPQITAYREALDKLYPNQIIKTYIYSFELNEMIELK